MGNFVFESQLTVPPNASVIRLTMLKLWIGGLTGLSAIALQEISTLLTAEKIVMRDPKTKSVYYNVETGLNDSVKIASGGDYRAAAERHICCSSSAGLPIVSGGYLRVEIYRFWEYCGNHNMTIIY